MLIKAPQHLRYRERLKAAGIMVDEAERQIMSSMVGHAMETGFHALR